MTQENKRPLLKIVIGIAIIIGVFFFGRRTANQDDKIVKLKEENRIAKEQYEADQKALEKLSNKNSKDSLNIAQLLIELEKAKIDIETVYTNINSKYDYEINNIKSLSADSSFSFFAKWTKEL